MGGSFHIAMLNYQRVSEAKLHSEGLLAQEFGARDAYEIADSYTIE